MLQIPPVFAQSISRFRLFWETPLLPNPSLLRPLRMFNRRTLPTKRHSSNRFFFTEIPDTVSQMELITRDGFFGVYKTLLVPLQHLLSRVWIHINSSKASVYPIIQPNYYSVPFDVKVATAGTTYLRKFAATPQYSAIFGTEVVPGEGADLQTYTTTVGFGTEFHPIGTASMLPRDQGGVVDSTLKVYGTSNVRVVDASIIPLHISAHPQATVYGIAEKAADIILPHY